MTDGGEKLYGENNPFYGHRHNEKTKEKISKIASLKTGEKNPFYNSCPCNMFFRLRLEGRGDVRLYSILETLEDGSDTYPLTGQTLGGEHE